MSVCQKYSVVSNIIGAESDFKGPYSMDVSRLHSHKNLSPLKICLRVFKEVLVESGRGLTGPGNLSAFFN